MLGVQGLHDDPALAAPGSAFGRKHALPPDFLKNGGQGAQAPIGLWALTEHLMNEVGVRDRDHRLSAQPQRIEWAIAVGPVLEDRMEFRRPSCKIFPRSGSPRGPGKVVSARPTGAPRRRRRVVVSSCLFPRARPSSNPESAGASPVLPPGSASAGQADTLGDQEREPSMPP